MVGTFLGLLAAAAGGVQPEALERADWGALPAALPVIALAFVYQNVVPVRGGTKVATNAVVLRCR